MHPTTMDMVPSFCDVTSLKLVGSFSLSNKGVLASLAVGLVGADVFRFVIITSSGNGYFLRKQDELYAGTSESPTSSANLLCESSLIIQSLLFEFRCRRVIKSFNSCDEWMLGGMTFQSCSRLPARTYSRS
jgi:hypothetical protein